MKEMLEELQLKNTLKDLTTENLEELEKQLDQQRNDVFIR